MSFTPTSMERARLTERGMRSLRATSRRTTASGQDGPEQERLEVRGAQEEVRTESHDGDYDQGTRSQGEHRHQSSPAHLVDDDLGALVGQHLLRLIYELVGEVDRTWQVAHLVVPPRERLHEVEVVPPDLSSPSAPCR